MLCLDEAAQATEVCERVLDARERGAALREQAVLMRASHDSGLLELELARRDIPYVKYGGLRYLEAAHVKDFLALLRLADNPADRLAWFRWLQLLDGVGPATRRARARGARARQPAGWPTSSRAGPPRRARSRPRRAARPTRSSPRWAPRSTSPRPGVRAEGLRDALAPIVEAHYPDGAVRLLDLDALVAAAGQSPDLARFVADLVLDPPASSSDLAGPGSLDEDWLVLSTVHSAKGLEWRAVHVLALYDGNFPSDLAAGDREAIEEERRLLYVALTRAQRDLHLYVPLRYYHRPRGIDDGHGYGKASRFLTEEVQALCRRTDRTRPRRRPGRRGHRGARRAAHRGLGRRPVPLRTALSRSSSGAIWRRPPVRAVKQGLRPPPTGGTLPPRAMGQEVAARVFSRADRQRYREKVRTCLDVFARMLADEQFEAARGSFGLEIELNLTDDDGRPALANAAVLEAIADPDFQTELGQFNIEINIAPRQFGPTVFAELEESIRGSLNHAESRSRTAGAHMVVIGILPTIDGAHLNANALSANPRYALLNEQIFAARGEDLEIDIRGVERLSTYADTIAPEAACTSVQLHLQVEPDAFAAHWNAAQAIAGVQVAVARQLALLLRQGAVARDAHRALRAGDRHPPRRAQGAGRAPARVVRRALDHVDLRPLRGERPLLPGAAAGVRGRGPGRDAHARRHPRACPSCACTTARSTAGTAPSTTSCAAARTCGSRTGSCPPARRWSTSSPTRPSTTAWSRS